VNKQQTIAKLEALLTRVRTRTDVARPARVSPAPADDRRALELAATAVAAPAFTPAPAPAPAIAPAPVFAPPTAPAPAPPTGPAPPPAPAPAPSPAFAPPTAPAPSPAFAPPTAPAFAPAPPPPLHARALHDEAPDSQPTRPPPAPPNVITTDAELIEVDVQEALGDTVIGVPADEVPFVDAAESRERLVAAEPVALEPNDGVAELLEASVEDEVTVQRSVPAIEPEPELEIEPVAPAPPAEPRIAVAPPVPPPAPVPHVASAPHAEAPPSELLASEEDVEEAPLSSRRPVAPEPEERLAELAFGAEEPRPPIHTPPPESGRLPAAPVVEFDADVTGVREAAHVPARAREAAPELARPLEPEATKAELGSGEAVADVIGEARGFAPATFVALLDASLAL